MVVIITVKLIFLTLFIFAIIQKFIPSIHSWLNRHQCVLTVLSMTTIITFTISFIDILINT